MYRDVGGEGLSIISSLASATSYWARTTCWADWLWTGWCANPRSQPGALTCVPTSCIGKQEIPEWVSSSKKHIQPHLDPTWSAPISYMKDATRLPGVFTTKDPNKINWVCWMLNDLQYYVAYLGVQMQSIKPFEPHSLNPSRNYLLYL